MNEMRKLMEAVADNSANLEAELDNLKRRYAEVLAQIKQGHAEDDPETMFSYEMEMFQDDVHDYLDELGFFEEDDDDDDDWRMGAGNPRFMDDEDEEEDDDDDEDDDSAINFIAGKPRI